MVNNGSSPFMSILIFLILTILYFITKYYLQIKDTSSNTIVSALVIYIGFLIFFELIININLTKSLCGSNQWSTAFLVTAIPWVVIFGLLNMLLLLFPGWLVPFSNTFGYLIVKFAGLNKILNEILKPYDKTSNKQLSTVLSDIYHDPSLLINEVDGLNFDKFWNSLGSGGLLKSNINSELKKKLKDLIYLKNIVAEFCWFLLTGLLTTSASYNFIINSACSHSIKQMEQNHKDYMKKLNIKDDAEKSAPPRRIYATNE